MLKIRFFTFTFFLAHLCHGQTLTIEGVVYKSNSSESLPYATIAVKGTTRGTATDLSGKFSLQAGNTDSLIFSFVGFKTSIIPVSEFSTPVFMQEEVTKLETSVVKSSKKFQDAIVGNTQAKTAYLFGGSNQYAFLLKNAEEVEGVLEELYFNVQPDIDKQNLFETAFKIRVYKNENNLPGEDLLKENLVTIIRKKEKKINFNISNYNIIIPAEGIFIGLDLLGFFDENKNFIPYNLNRTALNVRVEFSESETFATYSKFFGTEWKKVMTRDQNGNPIKVSAKFGAKISY